jgi:hypothetical protein
MTTGGNENWGQCPKCGSPVLIDPSTGSAESCSNCATLASRVGLYAGVFWIVAGLAVVVLIVYFCVRPGIGFVAHDGPRPTRITITQIGICKLAGALSAERGWPQLRGAFRRINCRSCRRCTDAHEFLRVPVGVPNIESVLDLPSSANDSHPERDHEKFLSEGSPAKCDRVAGSRAGGLRVCIVRTLASLDGG